MHHLVPARATSSWAHSGSETYRIVKRYLTRGGEPLWGQLTVALARDTTGAPLYFISMIEDVTTERAAHRALAHQAAHDELPACPTAARC